MTGQGGDGALAVVGGPLGRHASARARSWLATVTPLLVISSAMVGLGVAQRGHCVANGWNGTDQFWRGCFSDLPALYRIGNLDAGLGGYLSGAANVDHPVLTGSLMALVGGLVPAGNVLAWGSQFGFWANREEVTLLIGVIDQQFIKNIRTVLAETRGALVVSVPAFVLYGPVTAA